MSDDLRYPVGRFEWPAAVSEDDRRKAIASIASTPARMRSAVSGLDEGQLDTPYREGGWTLRQVIHHLPESHMNSYIRFKLALTEEEPEIKPYDEGAWARTPDALAPAEPSLLLLEALHDRWVTVLKGISDAEWQRRFRHPERGAMELDKTLLLYAWHCDHHVGHVTSLRERMGW